MSALSTTSYKRKRKKSPKPCIQLEPGKSLLQVKSDKSAHNLSFWTKFSATKLRNKWITIVETSTLSRFFSHLLQALHLNKKDAPSKKPFDRIRLPSLGLSKTERKPPKQGGVSQEPGVGMPPLHFLIAHGRAINYFLRRRRGVFISHSLKGVIPHADNKFLVLSVTIDKDKLNNCLWNIFEIFFFWLFKNNILLKIYI